MVALQAAGTSQDNKGFGAERASRQSPIANGSGRWPLIDGGVDPITALIGSACFALVLAVLLVGAAIATNLETPAEHPGAAAAAGVRTDSPRSSGATFDRAREPALDTSGAALGGSGITAEARDRQSRGRQSPIGMPEPPTPKPEARPPGPIRDPEPETRHPL